MSAEDTLILHKKEKVSTGNEAEKIIQGISTTPSPEKKYADKGMTPQGTPPTSATSQDDHGDGRQEREVQRIILEANLADNEFFSSSESDISKDAGDDNSGLNLDFLETFSGVPSLDAISLGSGHQKGLRQTYVKESETSFNKDEGVFVDPLTGEAIVVEMPGKLEEEIENVQLELESEDLTATEEMSDLIFSFSDDTEMAGLLETPVEQFEVKVIDESEAFDDFLMQDAAVEHIPSSMLDKESYEQERIYNLLMQETELFLNKLINQAVARAEYKHPMAVLRARLDKFALMEEIFNKLEELEIERRTRFNLNRKVIEYYKRKKSFKAFTDTPEEDDAQHIAKLNEATRKLDEILSIEDYIKEKFDIISKSLRAQKIALQQANITKEREFETLVRATFIKNNTVRLAVVVPQLIEKINTFRGYVSDSRLQLIQYQHTSAVLQKSIDDFENQFRIREYMALQTETTELDKKIEERNADLENLRTRCNTDIHAFTHIKEKVDILRLFTQMKKKALAVLQADKQQVRERVVTLKVDRTNYQKEIRELTFQSGLLSKPSLLRDYDHTVKQLKEVRKRVEVLRHQRAELTEKINKLEKKYDVGYISRNAIKIK